MHMSSMDHLILVLLSMVVAFLPRFIPLRIFSTREIPQWFNEWMKYVPVSLFTALVVKDIFINTKDYSFIGLGYRCSCYRDRGRLPLTFNGTFSRLWFDRSCVISVSITSIIMKV